MLYPCQYCTSQSVYHTESKLEDGNNTDTEDQRESAFDNINSLFKNEHYIFIKTMPAKSLNLQRSNVRRKFQLRHLLPSQGSLSKINKVTSQLPYHTKEFSNDERRRTSLRITTPVY